MNEIGQAIVNTLSKITAVSGGRNVRLVAVSKTKPKEDLLEAYNAEQRHFGENYVQELLAKSHELPNDIKWHFIGHLQTNKVKKLLETRNLWVIETVDTLKLAKEINKHLETNKVKPFNTTLELPLRIFVQVKTSDEESKSGVEPSECLQLVQAIMNDLPNLKVAGLMTIGKLDGDPVEDFTLLNKTRKEVTSALGLPEEDLELSMGMSSDYEIAIQHGSTNVRVGSTIFGVRAKKTSAAPSQP